MKDRGFAAIIPVVHPSTLDGRGRCPRGRAASPRAASSSSLTSRTLAAPAEYQRKGLVCRRCRLRTPRGRCINELADPPQTRNDLAHDLDVFPWQFIVQLHYSGHVESGASQGFR
jgi:hypothetical protein